MSRVIRVIGIGENGAAGLSQETLEQIERADLLVGGERQLGFFKAAAGEKRTLKSGLSAVVEELGRLREDKDIVVLASGDPLFFGIAGYLSAKLGAEHLDIMPHLSSVQLAFARLGESWQDAVLESVHGRPMTGLAQRIDGQNKVALLTDDRNHPGAVAAYLLHYGMTEYDAFVGEYLGGPDEVYQHYTLDEMAQRTFQPLNVVILRRRKGEDVPAIRRGFGFEDAEFHQRKPEKGLITKREVRVFSLSELRLTERSIVWDIGAGSGSVAVECARLAKYGQVFAIEKNEGDLANVEANKIKFRTDFPVIHAKAPAGLDELPDPDAVFIGGSGGELSELIRLCASRLRKDGRIVVNAATIETLHDGMKAMQTAGLDTSVTLLQTARSKPILNMTRFDGLNPIYVITGQPSVDVADEVAGE
ncbi:MULTISPECIES: bifunctional cobalt-precorrin-7 (C(5))-methyltransferase/cobalt-precorrin-6B (C(15))-methyltransferase [Paenibacillus]|uniref:bifunctional cobalt-precorrin-7 (C(5))-methyltransferase/cobalt-precorrin-6B (C(15))-methyltransferase n=1 Tax=Paenibacillus TaxID=44249 RepID=UPI0004117C7A|nr:MULTISPECIES: bifunctional cobalt-precorrin-7 (C(5))-methyltransferase/cobalt-precorrin-6B (C(15))-methyltransferase [Paenibacillus]UMY54521.1 bifunctional cobalt-precorrin-7 (C(5))-methyltransferase/cobalt-precorrin-6B (C(15))-methyltransferase [Paenibacillus peoriae]